MQDRFFKVCTFMAFSLNRYIYFKTETPNRGRTLLLMAGAYLFGIAVRMIMFYFISSDKGMWQSSGAPIPILTPDTGVYGYYAQQILAGNFYPLGQSDRLPGYLLAFFSYLLSVNMDWLIVLLPVFIAPLTVIPMILIGNSVKMPTLGFIAALFLMADLNYFGRSYLAYFDTDILNLFFPLLAIYSMIRVSQIGRMPHALIGAIGLWGFGLWYHSSASIIASLILVYIFTTLIFFRKRVANYQALFMYSAVLLPLHPLLTLIAITLLSLFFAWLNRTRRTSEKPYLVLLFLGAVAVAFSHPTHLYHRALAYFDRPEMMTLHAEGATYYFFNQMQTIAEAIPANLFFPAGTFNHQSSLAMIATIGFLLLLLRIRYFFFMLPLFILGVSSFVLGNRFLMYAAPPLSFGMAFLLVILVDGLKKHSQRRYLFKAIRFAMVSVMLAFMVELVYSFSDNYETLFRPDEIKALRNFSHQLHQQDTLLSWWDYGWPLWYYTGHNNTFEDNGEHGGCDSYIVSRILLSDSQTFAANAALYFSTIQKEARQKGYPFALQYLVEGGADLNATFERLEHTPILSAPQHAVYILLQSELMNYLYTINESSDFDITTGKRNGPKTMLQDILDVPYNPKQNYAAGQRYRIDNIHGTVTTDSNSSYDIKQIAVSKAHRLLTSKTYSNQSNISIAILKDVHAIYLDDTLFNSFFIQAYLFDHYDKTRFEKVVETPYMKIFKVLPPPRV